MAADGKDGWAGVLHGKPKIGQVSERSRTTVMSDIHAFTEMTGDRNPVHYDEELAKKTMFGIIQANPDDLYGISGNIINYKLQY